MNKELNEIKKLYGEEMMHICRDLFPSVLEHEGLLLSILKNNIALTHSFADDIKKHCLYDEFRMFIYSFIDVEIEHEIVTNKTKTPFELMDEAGYTLYECKSESDIQSFRKYYKPDEVICTIENGGRLENCYVFFAVKKNVDMIKRENFERCVRQDEYGTSVISIQFSRGDINTLSIKNRYNHKVINPDATFSNNLNNIISGLKNSFEKFFGLNIIQNDINGSNLFTDSLKYIKAKDGRYYRYNVEIDGVYYCENNIIIKYGSIISEFSNNKERYLLLEQYVIDRLNKKIYLYCDSDDSFVESINKVGKIKHIDVTKNDENRNINICYSDGKQVKIVANKNNAIVGYENNYVCNIGDAFLYTNEQLREISIPQVQTIGYSFLESNKELIKVSIPQVQTIGDDFLYRNKQLREISIPQAQTIGRNFLHNNIELREISILQAQIIGHNFLSRNEQLREISIPQVKTIGDNFLDNNEELIRISIPQVQTIGDDFLYRNEQLREISIPQAKTIGDSFLDNNEKLIRISIPQAQTIGDHFLSGNEQLREISIPLVQTIGYSFLYANKQLREISMPLVQTIGDYFLCRNEQLREISIPLVQTIGKCFLYNTKELNVIFVPHLQAIGHDCLRNNPQLCNKVLLQIEKNNKGKVLQKTM